MFLPGEIESWIHLKVDWIIALAHVYEEAEREVINFTTGKRNIGFIIQKIVNLCVYYVMFYLFHS